MAETYWVNRLATPSHDGLPVTANLLAPQPNAM